MLTIMGLAFSESSLIMHKRAHPAKLAIDVVGEKAIGEGGTPYGSVVWETCGIRWKCEQ